MKSKRQVQQLFKKVQDKRQPVRPYFNAWMGHSDGITIDVVDRPGYVWIREGDADGRLMQARNRAVLPRYNQPVKVGYSDDLPGTLDVLTLNTMAMPPQPGSESGWDGSAQLAKHAGQHDIGGGDTDWIQSLRLLPLRPRPQTTADLTIFVEQGPYPFGSTFKFFAGAASSDMTSHIPSTAGNALYRIVYIDGATNVLAYVNTAEFVADPFISRTSDIIALIPVGAIPIAAVYLPNGITTITESEIFDIRILFSPSPGSVAAGGGSGVLWENIIIVAISGGDHATIGAAITAASTGDLIVVAPGTYAENLTLKADVHITGMFKDATLSIISPVSGVPITIPSDAGQYTVHSMTITPPAGEIAVDNNMGASGAATFFGCDIKEESGASVASVDGVGANVSSTISVISSTVRGDMNGKSILNFTQSDCHKSMLPSASAGAIKIEHSRIRDKLTHVASQTVSLFNMPQIDGTVSGSGTLTGAYLNSAGGVVVAGLTATRIPFATTAGLLTDDADLAFDGSQLALAVQGSSGGVLLGGDVLFYRNSANVGRTPDALTVDGAFQADGGVIFNEAGADVNFRVESDNNTHQLFVDAGADGVGIDTGTVPHGGIGYAMFAIDGPDGNALGPHIQHTTDADDFPTFQHLNWTHDNIALLWDSYYDGNWKSSDAGSNFRLYKLSDTLTFHSSFGVAQGSAITWADRFSIKAAEVSFNEGGGDFDFRAEGDTDTDLLFVDASTDRVGISTNAPAVLFHVAGAAQVDGAFQADGGAIFNEAGADVDFRVEGDTNANMIHVDAGLDNLGFGKVAHADYFIDIGNTSEGRIFNVQSEWSTTVTPTLYGILFDPIFTGAASPTTVYPAFFRLQLNAVGQTVANLHTIRIASPVITNGAITTLNGLTIADMTAGGTANYAIYTNAGTVRFGGGVILGAPTGGDKGAGTLNAAGDIYKNDTAYTNPDFVLEHWATGRIDRYAARARAENYTGLMALDDLRNHIQKHHRLPRIGDEPAGMFERGDVALEKIEELTLYILQQEERIKTLEAQV